MVVETRRCLSVELLCPYVVVRWVLKTVDCVHFFFLFLFFFFGLVVFRVSSGWWSGWVCKLKGLGESNQPFPTPSRARVGTSTPIPVPQDITSHPFPALLELSPPHPFSLFLSLRRSHCFPSFSIVFFFYFCYKPFVLLSRGEFLLRKVYWIFNIFLGFSGNFRDFLGFFLKKCARFFQSYFYPSGVITRKSFLSLMKMRCPRLPPGGDGKRLIWITQLNHLSYNSKKSFLVTDINFCFNFWIFKATFSNKRVEVHTDNINVVTDPLTMRHVRPKR